MKVLCFACGEETQTGERVGRRESCRACGSDLHSCRNCRFYDPLLSNQCREPQAERQVDKEHSNFCDYFEAAAAVASPSAKSGSARAALESLFDRSKK